MNNIVKQPMLPDTIHFHHTICNDNIEVMRITRTGVWVNPDMSIDDTAKAVLAALDSQIKVLVLAEREACAQVCDEIANRPSNMVLGVALDCAAAIRARGEK
jgi:hypothetical protein